MADYSAHFDVEEDGETVTRRGRLELYNKETNTLKVKLDGEIQTHDLDQLNKIAYQKFEDDSQQEMFD